MVSPTRRSRVATGVAALVACLALLAAAPADAQRRKKAPTYAFLVTDVELKSGVPKEIEDLVRKRLAAAIDSHAKLIGALDDDAPDPEADPKAYERYLEARRIKAYKVNVEVTGYERTAKPNPKKSGNVLTVHVALRLFGEQVPQRVMAFTGDGSSTIKLETGKNIRDRDEAVAHEDATELAVSDAIATSLRKLAAKAKKKK